MRPLSPLLCLDIELSFKAFSKLFSKPLSRRQLLCLCSTCAVVDADRWWLPVVQICNTVQVADCDVTYD